MEPLEQWRPVPVLGLEHLYQVSSHGRVRSQVSHRVISGGVTSAGYRRVLISSEPGHRNKRSHYIHRLVCEAFHGTPGDGQQVDHIDGDKLNNAASNLEWVDCRENTRRAIATGVRPSQHGTNSVRSKLTAEQVCAIRGEPHQHGVLTRLARRFGVSRETIARIRSGKSYRDVTDSGPKTTRENHT